VRVPKKPIKVEIVQKGDQRFLAKTFADGSEERLPILKQHAKPRPPGPYRYRDMNKRPIETQHLDGKLIKMSQRRRKYCFRRKSRFR
jgi:hypothetical protein